MVSDLRSSTTPMPYRQTMVKMGATSELNPRTRTEKCTARYVEGHEGMKSDWDHRKQPRGQLV